MPDALESRICYPQVGFRAAYARLDQSPLSWSKYMITSFRDLVNSSIIKHSPDVFFGSSSCSSHKISISASELSEQKNSSTVSRNSEENQRRCSSEKRRSLYVRVVSWHHSRSNDRIIGDIAAGVLTDIALSLGPLVSDGQLKWEQNDASWKVTNPWRAPPKTTLLRQMQTACQLANHLHKRKTHMHLLNSFACSGETIFVDTRLTFFLSKPAPPYSATSPHPGYISQRFRQG